MYNINKLFLILFLLFFGCTSSSMEFSSAKSAARAEKDLKRGEEWGLKALEIESDKNNALVPYFIATEIYKPQERWEEMAEMLDEAMRRNPKQKLEEPKYLIPLEELTQENFEEMVIETIEEGVNAYREEAWTLLYNQAVEFINIKKNELALEKLNLCITMDSSKLETYTTLVGYYATNDDFKTARKYVNKGIATNPSYILYAMASELLEKEFRILDAEKMCLKAIEMAESEGKDSGTLKIKLFLLNLEMGENQKAINISNGLLDIYYDNPDLYFNVGVLYQRLATKLYDEAAVLYKLFNESSEFDESLISIKKMYKEFVQAMNYAQKSKENFLEANDLEIEDTGSREAAAEMRRLVRQIKDIYIPSIQKIAESKGINLN